MQSGDRSMSVADADGRLRLVGTLADVLPASRKPIRVLCARHRSATFGNGGVSNERPACQGLPRGSPDRCIAAARSPIALWTASHAPRLPNSRKKAPEMSAATGATRTSPTVTGHLAFWQCSDGKTTLTVDLRGNASYSGVRSWSPEASPEATTLSHPASRVTDDGALVQKTRHLAAAWLLADEFRSAKPAIKRETLLLAKLPAGKITELADGRSSDSLDPMTLGTGTFKPYSIPTAACCASISPLRTRVTRIFATVHFSRARHPQVRR